MPAACPHSDRRWHISRGRIIDAVLLRARAASGVVWYEEQQGKNGTKTPARELVGRESSPTRVSPTAAAAPAAAVQKQTAADEAAREYRGPRVQEDWRAPGKQCKSCQRLVKQERNRNNTGGMGGSYRAEGESESNASRGQKAIASSASWQCRWQRGGGSLVTTSRVRCVSDKDGRVTRNRTLGTVVAHHGNPNHSRHHVPPRHERIVAKVPRVARRRSSMALQPPYQFPPR